MKLAPESNPVQIQSLIPTGIYTEISRILHDFVFPPEISEND